MTEFGIFSDLAGGCIASGYWSREAAEADAADIYAEDDPTVLVLCRDHEEQPADSCEECFAEDDEPEEEA